MAIIAGARKRPWEIAGVPTDGTSGTYAKVAETGDLLIDTINGDFFQNTNTQDSPTWTQFSAGGGLGGTPTTIQPDDSAAEGSSGNSAKSDHVHENVCDTPVDGSLTAANAEGISTSFARADHNHRTVIVDSDEIEFGSGYDAVLGWQVGDSDNHTLVLGLADANQAIHISDKSAIGTDWDVTADPNPSIYLHSDTTPATDFLKMYHDATDGWLRSFGGTLKLDAPTGASVNVCINGNVEYSFAATALNMNDNVIDMGSGYLNFGSSYSLGSGWLRLPNATFIWGARNFSDDGDIPGWSVNTEDKYESHADVQMNNFTVHGGWGANEDLILNGTTNATKTTSYIIAQSMMDMTADGAATKVIAGVVSDGSFTATATDGLLGLDSANGRLYFRYGGAWHYCTQDA